MTKEEFRILHNFSSEDMERIDFVVKFFNGKIINISEKIKI